MRTSSQPNLTDNRGLRVVTLCTLYVAQGIPFGFVTVTLVAYLSGQGLTAKAVAGVSAMSTLPWAFKWLWGPVIDRFGLAAMGHRRPWILLAQLLMALTLGAMILIPDLTSGVALLGWMVLIHNCFVALQDVSVDALAVDILAESERGRVNGFMYASKYLGTSLGGAGIGLVVARFGLRTALVLQVGVLMAIMLLPLLLRERAGEKLLPWTAGRSTAPEEEKPVKSTRRLFGFLLRAFSLRAALLTAAVALACYVGTAVLASAAAIYFIQNLGWTEKEFSAIIGGYGVWAGMAGSVLGGLAADKIGPKRMIAASCVALGLAWIGFSYAQPLWQYKTAFVMPFTVLEAFLMGMFSVSFFSLAMGVSWPKVAGTQFTAYMALMNLSSVLGYKAAGYLYERWEFGTLYFAMGVLEMLILVPLVFIDPHQTRRVLSRE